ATSRLRSANASGPVGDQRAARSRTRTSYGASTTPDRAGSSRPDRSNTSASLDSESLARTAIPAIAGSPANTSANASGVSTTTASATAESSPLNVAGA